ncbi:MAG: hypothetical protein NVSMB9_06820 [Isosphaeraceae bacterium]
MGRAIDSLSRRKMLCGGVWNELPGSNPDPSVGKPRFEGLATRLLGRAQPRGQGPRYRTLKARMGPGVEPAVREIRSVRDILVTGSPGTSARADLKL